MDKDVQLEVIKALIGLPTSVLLSFFLITIYRDFRSLVAALLTFFKIEFTAWLALFRDVFKAGSTGDSEKGDSEPRKP